MESCDVLIVGGGPGGSSCAWGLRDAGLDVLVLDRARFPRDKTCAGWITPQVLESLRIDADVYAKDRVLQPITGFRVRRVGDRDVCVRWEEPISYGIRRCELDHFLLERCEARTRLGEPLRTLERSSGGWVANGEIEARVVVGAGGHFCPVGRRLSTAGSSGEPIVAAQELEFRLEPEDRDDGRIEPEVPELFFTADLKGYGWVFRKGDFLNVGLGRQDKAHLSAHVERFLEFLRALGKLPRHMEDHFAGHAYLLYDQAPRRLLDDGVLLVGDAAGMAYPRSGEGIRPAVEAGLLAARVLRDARGDYSASRLEPYRAALERRFGRREPRIPIGLTDLLPAPVMHALVGRLLAHPWFARHFVVERWFVHRAQTALTL